MSTIIRHEVGQDRMYKIWHRAEGNMLLYIHKGAGSIVLPENVYPLKPGVLCFIGSEVYHHTLPDLSTTYQRSKVFINDDLLEKLAHTLDLSITPHSIICGIVDEDVDIIFNWMTQYGVAGGYLQLLSMLSNHADHHTYAGRSAIDRSIIYIQQHAAENISIDDICNHIHVSKFHFCRKFKDRTGYTVMRYILKTRISMACIMLEQSKYNIGQISEECGFSSPDYFSRAFKNEMGLSPMQYKKNAKPHKSKSSTV